MKVNDTVYITKFALSQGIIQATVTNVLNDRSNSVQLQGYDIYFLKGHEVFLSYQEAIQKAERMRLSKIKSLKKSLEKFEGLKFH